jgi:hypothetical protein
MKKRWRETGKGSRSGQPRAGRGGWRVAAAVAGLLVCGTLLFRPVPASAQSEDDAEYRLKMAFLYNFAQFVNWPAEAFRGPSAPLTMCVAGRDPFQGEIEKSLHGRTAGVHPIELRKLKPNDDPRSCHLIFVPAGDRKLSERILAAVKGSSTLTVGESKGFADIGGVINLTAEQNKLRFEINLDAAQRTQLKISSKLLALAKIVRVP